MARMLKAGVQCPNCGSAYTQVIDTRGSKRRRKCESCKHRYATIEMLYEDVELVDDIRQKCEKYIADFEEALKFLQDFKEKIS